MISAKHNDYRAKCERMAAAYKERGYTMREIAEYVNVHYTLVSKIIRQ